MSVLNLNSVKPQLHVLHVRCVLVFHIYALQIIVFTWKLYQTQEVRYKEHRLTQMELRCSGVWPESVDPHGPFVQSGCRLPHVFESTSQFKPHDAPVHVRYRPSKLPGACFESSLSVIVQVAERHGLCHGEVLGMMLHLFMSVNHFLKYSASGM